MQATNNDNIITDNTEEEDIISIVSDLTHPIYLDEQEQAVQRFRAIVNNEHTYQQILEQQTHQDDFERTLPELNYRSIYDSYCNFLSWTGDTSPVRFWYNISVHVVDATTDSYLYVDDLDTTYNPDCNYYQTDPSEYQQLVIPINRKTTSREYGRVFFHTATYYIPDGSITFPRRKTTPIRGYIRHGNRKIYCTSYRNPNKGILYYNKPGILKELTPLGQVIDTIFYNRSTISNYPISDQHQGSLISTFYHEIRTRYNYQVNDWIYNIRRIEPPYTTEHIDHRNEIYNENWNDFETHIDTIYRERLKYKYSCIRIQRFWKSKYIRRLESKSFIVQVWRRYILRYIGIRFTILHTQNININFNPSNSTNNNNPHLDILFSHYITLIATLFILFIIYIEQHTKNI